MMQGNGKITILVGRDTQQKLIALKIIPEETYDSVIKRLLKDTTQTT